MFFAELELVLRPSSSSSDGQKISASGGLSMYLYAVCGGWTELGRVTASSVWEVINMYPQNIRSTCRALAAIPTTQVSVERAFSQLKLIMRDNRASLKSDLTEALLFLRINKLV